VGKRKRNRQSIFEFKKPRLSTNGTRCHSSDQEGSMMEDAISPEAPFNSAFQQRPLGDAGSILSCKLSRLDRPEPRCRFVIE